MYKNSTVIIKNLKGDKSEKGDKFWQQGNAGMKKERVEKRMGKEDKVMGNYTNVLILS